MPSMAFSTSLAILRLDQVIVAHTLEGEAEAVELALRAKAGEVGTIGKVRRGNCQAEARHRANGDSGTTPFIAPPSDT